MKVLDENGTSYLVGKVKDYVSSGYVQTSRKINNHALTADITLTADDIGDGSTNKAYTATEKTKLGNIESGAQVNVIESIKVNGTAVTPTNKEVDITIPAGDNQTVKAGNVTFGANDVVEIEAGSNVTVTGNATNKKITIAATDTTYSAATTSAAGLMPALDSASVSTQSQSTKFLREDGTWSAPSYTLVDNMIRQSSNAVENIVLYDRFSTTKSKNAVLSAYNDQFYLFIKPVENPTLAGHNEYLIEFSTEDKLFVTNSPKCAIIFNNGDNITNSIYWYSSLEICGFYIGIDKTKLTSNLGSVITSITPSAQKNNIYEVYFTNTLPNSGTTQIIPTTLAKTSDIPVIASTDVTITEVD